MVRRNPYGHVFVEARTDNGPVPQVFLDQSFTTYEAAINALDDYARKHREGAQDGSSR
jgi:hypothetical protein